MRLGAAASGLALTDFLIPPLFWTAGGFLFFLIFTRSSHEIVRDRGLIRFFSEFSARNEGIWGQRRRARKF